MGKEEKDIDCLETFHHFLNGMRGLHAQEGSHVFLTFDDYLQDLPNLCLVALLNCFRLQVMSCHFHAHLHLKGNEKSQVEKQMVYTELHHCSINIPMKPVDSVLDFALSKEAP